MKGTNSHVRSTAEIGHWRGAPSRSRYRSTRPDRSGGWIDQRVLLQPHWEISLLKFSAES